MAANKVPSIALVMTAALLAACTGSIADPSTGGLSDDGSSPFAGPSGSTQQPTNPDGTPAAQTPGSPTSSSSTTPKTPAASTGTVKDNGSSPAPTAQSCTTPSVGASPLRRLTHSEYNNSVADLLGDTTHPGSAFVADTQEGLFDNTASTQTVPVLLAEQYLNAASQLADGIKDVTKLVGCDPAGSTGATCVRSFIDRFGRRAYRRPLSTDEATRLAAVYDTARTASDAPTGVRAVVTAMLASPNFLFRPEFGSTVAGTIANAKPLTAYELAGRLASLVWASAPDDVLLDAAAKGQLTTRAQVETQARRMLADPRARPALSNFYTQWFGMARIKTAAKDATAYPDFNDVLRDSMGEETRRFIDDVLWNGDAQLTTMLTASYSFVNKPLAALYGVAGPSDANTYTRVNLDPKQRSGVFTQASMLAGYARPDQSSPIKRGQWLRVRLLCQELPDPPANVPELPMPVAGVSNRERFAMHTNNPACSGCHNLIDGLGFGLEAYDGIGRFRTMDQGVAVDSSGNITSSDIDGAYNGAPELAARLASSAQVRDCAPTQWLRYAIGRKAEDADGCSLLQLKQAFADSKGDLRELMVELTQTDVFWNYRQAQ